MVCMRALRGFAALCLVLAACATGASSTDDTSDDDSTAPDAHTGQPPDAHTGAPDAMETGSPDANVGPTPRTLSQSNSQTITDAHAVTCNQFASGTTASAENRFYRVFDLSALGITTTYTVTRFDFSIESAASTQGSFTVQVKLHTLSTAPSGNSFPLANLTQIGGQNVTITPTTLSTQQVTLSPPVVVPAGSRLVAELFTPDLTGLGNGNSFFPGSNAAGETGATYIQATACSLTDPTKISTVVSPDPQVHWIMALQGTTP
jgi:hypothetical protein